MDQQVYFFYKFFSLFKKMFELVQLLYIYFILFESLFIIVYSLLLLIPLIISIAFFTLAERKIMASIQRRRGPNVVGF
jgi:NADH:ubiquinone oxidoreductase subunit H